MSLKTGLRIRRAPQPADQQTGAAQEQHGDGNLAGNEKSTQARASNAAPERCAFIFERSIQIGLRKLQRWRQSKDETRGERQYQSIGQHTSIGIEFQAENKIAAKLPHQYLVECDPKQLA